MESQPNHRQPQELKVHNLAPSPARGKGALWLIGGFVLLVVLFVLGLMPKLQAQQALAKETHDAQTATPQVDFAMPRIAPADAILLPANIQAITTTTIQARTSGYVKKLYVDIGSTVKAGQILAEIESPDADQQLAQAIADTAHSRAAQGQSEAAIASSVAGVSQTQADLARQRANIKQAQAAVAGAKAKLAQAKALQSQAEAHVAQSKQGVLTQKANLAQAKAQHELAAATVKRYESLLNQGYIARQDYDQAVAADRSATATVSAATANVSGAEADVKSSEQALAAAASSVQASVSDLDAAIENVNAAKATYNSLQATVAAAKAGVRASQENAIASKASVSSSEANERRYAALHGFQTIVAPFDGVITARNVDVGSLVSPGSITNTSAQGATTPNQGLFGIASIDTLRVYVNVPQTNFQSIKEGAKATILVRELPQETFEGTIVRSAGALDSSSRTLLTEVRLSNPKHLLLPGMYAQVQLSGDDSKPILRIPVNTLTVDASGTRVYAIDDKDVVHILNVTIGRDFGTEVEITNGIQPGQRLVANPTDAIKDGATVKVNPPAPEPGKTP